jgi:hypothetical protein
MAGHNLKLSNIGITKLTEYEASMDGPYDGPKGYCTLASGILFTTMKSGSVSFLRQPQPMKTGRNTS